MCFKSPKMRKIYKTLIYLDNNELNLLKDDEFSFVEVKKCEHHLSLHPFHLSNVNSSVKEILNKQITKYNRSLGGIVLGYQNVKILGTVAPINFDSCFVHVDVEVEFFIFKPEIDQILHGVVNKKSPNHIGCLVHKIFNVSLPQPNEDESWLGTKAQVGQEIQFKITLVDLDGRLPYIRGELISILADDSGISTSEETAFPSPNKPTRIIFDDEEEEPSTSKKRKADAAEVNFSPKKKHKKNIDTEELDSPAKKKKHKKKKDDSTEETDSPTKKKKHKKKKDDSIAETNSATKQDDSIAETKKKKHKKCKVDDLEETDSPTKKKHKKINVDDVEEMDSPTKKKHKNNKVDHVEEMDSPTKKNKVDDVEEMDSPTRKKHKKNKVDHVEEMDSPTKKNKVDNEEEMDSPTKKKHKNNKVDHVEEMDSPTKKNKVDDVEEMDSPTRKKHKKNKVDHVEEMDSPTKKNKVDDVEEMDSPTRKKHKKNKVDHVEEMDSPTKKNKVDNEEEMDSPTKKKHKDGNIEETDTPIKKKKHKDKEKEDQVSDLKQYYESKLNELSIQINKDNATSNKVSKKKKASKQKIAEADLEAQTDEIIVHKKKKSKKSKRENTSQSELDLSLPDLNLDALFNENTAPKNVDIVMANEHARGKKHVRNSTSHDISWTSKDITLPPDSDLENILQTASPRVKTKRRHSVSKTGADIDCNLPVKKLKKSKSKPVN